ncbi:MAG: hypothetical protein ABI051_10330 [Vicinamibacterales bacterium]
MRRDNFRATCASFVCHLSRQNVAIAGALAGTVGLALSAAGCTQAQTNGKSPAYLIVDSIQAASGATPDRFGNTLASDVLTVVKVPGSAIGVPTTYSDLGKVDFRLGLKDPGSSTTPNTPSTSNFITVNRYHVQFLRSDGRMTPGVDVPYPFDGAMTVTVKDSGGSGTFPVVRVQAKEEAPLRLLANGGGAVAISTIADITFYGSDQAGREVSVNGRVSVDFSDWGDPQ